jgi:hypothetical protein
VKSPSGFVRDYLPMRFSGPYEGLTLLGAWSHRTVPGRIGDGTAGSGWKTIAHAGDLKGAYAALMSGNKDLPFLREQALFQSLGY